MKLSVLIAISLFFAVGMSAQNPASPQDKCSIAGTVIDGVSGLPLKGANVRLAASVGPNGSRPGPAPASSSMSGSTDASGRFILDGLSPGRYLVLATHDGYVKVDPRFGERGKWILLAPGQQLTDIVVRLQPYAAIAGHITDEAGKPARGVTVQALRTSYLPGRREFHDMGHTASSDAGEYRIVGLAPGKYCIYAKPSASLKPKPPSNKAYVPLYYPAANDRAHAITLVLRAGEELGGMDVNLGPVHTVRIRGQVVNARTSLPSKEAEVTLLSDQGETIFFPGKSFPTGAFEFQGVPRGSYLVVAQQPSTPQEPRTIWGWTTVEVKDADVDHVEVVVGPGVDVSGRIQMESKTAEELSKTIASVVGKLDPRGGQALANLTPDIDVASVKPDGTFVFREVPPGSYSVSFFLLPAGFYLASSGEGDPLETGITVPRGHPPAAVELVVNSGAGRIDGTVESEENPVPAAVVALIPDGKRRVQPNSYRQALSDQSGRFALMNIAPGDYTIFAWEQIERAAYYDPEFLAQYEDRGKAVHVEEGGHVTIKLEAIPPTETVP
jgi:Carboxypeptidase regulatory-like domain